MEYSVCPITHVAIDRLDYPVVSAVDGHTYEKIAIEKWLAKHSCSPLTRQPMSTEDLIPNRSLMRASSQRSSKATSVLVIALDWSHQGDDSYVQAFRRGIGQMIDRQDKRTELVLLGFEDESFLPIHMTRTGKEKAKGELDDRAQEDYGDVNLVTSRCLGIADEFDNLPVHIVICTAGCLVNSYSLDCLHQVCSRIRHPAKITCQYLCAGDTDSFGITECCDRLNKSAIRSTMYYCRSAAEIPTSLLRVNSNMRKEETIAYPEEQINKINTLLSILTCWGHSFWYGLPGGKIEITPPEARIEKAIRLCSTGRSSPELITLIKEDRIGRHKLRSLKTCYDSGRPAQS